MDLKLIAMDLDGTLNDDTKHITPRTHDALMKAQAKGIRVVLASARPLPGLYRERDRLEVDKYDGILMAYNGGRIVNAKTGETLHRDSMDLETTKNVLRMLKTLPVNPIMDDGVQFYVTDKTAYKVEYECMNNNMVCTEVPDLAEWLDFAPTKILMSTDPDGLAEVQKTIAASLPEGLTVVQTAPFYLEIIPATINKGRGLICICEKLGIDIKDTVAFGDSENDIPMLKAAGLGVSMGNGTAACKAAADEVTLSNNEDGIAAVIERYI